MSKQFRYISFAILIATFVVSCKKTLEIPIPEDRIISDDVFTSDAKATAAMTGVYGNMINGSPGFSNFLITLYVGMSSDELKRFNPSIVFQEFSNNKLTSANAQVKNMWSSAYKNVYLANAILEGISNSSSISSNVSKQLIGESKFIRALSYFYLTNLFGDVPLVSTTNYQVNSRLTRTSTASVYQFIISDLLEASINLSSDFVSGEKGRPTKWAAKALLARVYLYLKDWNNASIISTEVINSGLFTPLEALPTVFLKNSREAIWQLIPSSGFLPETRQMLLSGPSPQTYLSSQLLASFEPGDQRRSIWIDSVVFQSAKYFFPTKYKNISTAVNEYYMVLRAAELFLIRAEAKVQLDDINGAEVDLNYVRNRSGLPNSIANDKLGLLLAIEEENRFEFFGEWAHRWFDLKRTNRITDILSPIKPDWHITKCLYPIPQDDILTNHNLTQNPGY